VSSLPLTGAVESTTYRLEGQDEQRPRPGQEADYSVVTPGYFRAMGVPLLAGRDFDGRDRAGGPSVVVVSQSLARRQWPNESAVGKRIRTGLTQGMEEIVGVVGDVKQTMLSADIKPALYLPQSQYPYPFLTVVLRTSADPASETAAMRREVAAVNPAVALTDVRTLDAVLAKSLAQQRFGLVLLGCFAGAAIVLAVVGIYGVIAYSVAQRTSEIGVRMALGARPRDAFRLVLGEGVRVTAAGLAVGLAASLALTRLLRALLYGVSATDPATFAAFTIALGGVALVATYVPARRATRVDPMVALRAE
jgi:putative ABC transport system permease protein